MPLIESFSGIRGIWNNGLDKNVCLKYAHIFNNFLKKKSPNPKIIIAIDTRHSGEEISKTISQVFQEVIDIGVAATPIAENAVRAFNADGGIIITASHNEPEWNGLKFLDNDGAVLRVKDIQNIIERYQKIKNKEIPQILTRPKISDMHSKALEEYSNFLEQIIGKITLENISNSKIKFIIDPNGGTGILSKNILDKFRIKYEEINTQYGIFSRKVEPKEISLSYLKKILRQKNLDAGFGFDCDADRVEVVHPEGAINGQYLLAVCADYILSKTKNPLQQVIVINDATSGIVSEIAKKHKAKILETDVGEINVIEEMIRNNSIVGGEGSSSGVIVSPSRCRDGILTMFILLGILAEKQKSLKQILEEYPKYFTIRKDIRTEIPDIKAFKQKISSYYRKKGFIVKESESIKVFLDEKTFIWFRLSKTENNLLRIIADSPDKSKAEKSIQEAEKLVHTIVIV